MELEFIRWLREHVPAHPRAPLGLSDDAAIVWLSVGEFAAANSQPGTSSPRRTRLHDASFGETRLRSDVVVTTDMLTDGVDFQLETDDLRRIGRQALGVNLSDLAAMAAEPLAAVISLALPRRGHGQRTALQLAISLYEGLLPLATEYDVAIAGGDTNTYDGPLVINVTALGGLSERGALTRTGAQCGDWLLVTGKLGGSILGHLFDFTPRVREANVLHERYGLHAGIDISDGLALDMSRLAEASGCGAVIFADRVPVSNDARRLAEREGASDIAASAYRHALGDGQDFELLFAAAPEVARQILSDKPLACGMTHVGELVAEKGLWQEDATGTRSKIEPFGWVHSG
jgi:thiamine-monophosphate kinase